MYPPEVLDALKEALRSIYHFRRDLRTFFENCEIPAHIIQKQRWDDPDEYKVYIAEKTIGEIVALRDNGIGAMRRLIQRVIVFEDFPHLRRLEDGWKKEKEAKVAVEHLRQLVAKHDEKLKLEMAKLARREEAEKQRVSTTEKQIMIKKLAQEFGRVAAIEDHIARGRALEPFLYQLFNAYDLNPRGSFGIIGEQIDGAFELDNTQYLLEATWEKDRIGAEEIRAFTGKVDSKLDNTLGLFFSINGFTEKGIYAIQRTRPTVILMDGQDLAAVLSGLIDLRELLRRKIRHASQTGDIYLKAGDAIGIQVGIGDDEPTDR